MIEKYGKLKSEKLADENASCRQIVSEISKFGISDRQRLYLIYLLALELENVEQLQSVTSLIKELASDDLFVSSLSESE